jgi:hypothetical protein
MSTTDSCLPRYWSFSMRGGVLKCFDGGLQNARSVQSFWQPQGTPDSDIRPDKPTLDVVCPVSGAKLKLKDLTPVKFTPAPDAADITFMDPVSKDILRNSSVIVVLKPSGDAMLEKTYKTCVKPDGTYNGTLWSFSDLSLPCLPAMTAGWHARRHS